MTEKKNRPGAGRPPIPEDQRKRYIPKKAGPKFRPGDTVYYRRTDEVGTIRSLWQSHTSCDHCHRPHRPADYPGEKSTCHAAPIITTSTPGVCVVEFPRRTQPIHWDHLQPI